MTTKKSNTISFTEKAKSVHGELYDYSRVDYVNNKTKVCIICPEHGEFWQTPNMHLRGRTCPLCTREKRKKTLTENSNKQRLTNEQFINKAVKIHGDKYDYSSTEYINNYTKVELICPIHGKFLINPSNHLYGIGCKKCTYESQKLTKQEFILKAREIHGWKYDYSKVEYKNNRTKICIICPEHGEFWQTPNSHLNGCGCSECAKKNFGKYRALTREDIISKFKTKHGERYDYSLFNYKGYDEKSEIICPEHGSFFITPHAHINGNGCKYCANKHLIGETKLKDTLEKNFNTVLYQVKSNTSGFEWLEKQSLDFFIPEINTAIEYQGEQHFKPIKYWGNEKKFIYTRKLDIEKNKKATDNNINIVYFKYGKIDTGDFPYEVIFEETELLDMLLEESKKGKLK